MNLSDIVTSLDLSKKLKELGVKQESLVYWLNIEDIIHMKVKDNGWEIEEDENGKAIIDKIDYRIELGNPLAYNILKENTWSAFTASELLEILPKIIESGDKYHPYQLTIKWELHYSGDMMWHIKYEKYNDGELDYIIYCENVSNVLAKMIIYLIENKLMETPK